MKSIAFGKIEADGEFRLKVDDVASTDPAPANTVLTHQPGAYTCSRDDVVLSDPSVYVVAVYAYADGRCPVRQIVSTARGTPLPSATSFRSSRGGRPRHPVKPDSARRPRPLPSVAIGLPPMSNGGTFLPDRHCRTLIGDVDLRRQRAGDGSHPPSPARYISVSERLTPFRDVFDVPNGPSDCFTTQPHLANSTSAKRTNSPAPQTT